MNVVVPKNSYLSNQEYLGFKNGQQLWRSPDGERYFTWDRLHGEIEVYNKRGRHLGAVDTAGRLLKEAVKGRKIDV